MKTEELLKIYKTGITYETYCKLLILQDCASYMFEGLDFTEIKLQGYCNVDLKLTKKGEDLLNLCGKPVKLGVDFVKLHEKLRQELKQLTGKNQKVLQGKYSFLPNSRDLQERLLKVSKKYQLNDWNLVEKLLLKYIYTCHKANWEFTPTLEYYIFKDNRSRLANDYVGYDEKESIKQEKIEPKEVKDLF